MSSVRTRFTGILAVFLIVGLLVVSSAGYFVAQRNLSDQVATRVLPLTGAHIYSEMRRDLETPIAALEGMVKEIAVHTLLKDAAERG